MFDKRLLMLTKKHKIEFTYDYTFGDFLGRYRPRTDSILISKKKIMLDTVDLNTTLAHELIHASGHKSRLNRWSLNYYGGLKDQSATRIEEGTAILGSILLLNHFNLKEESNGNESYYESLKINKLKSKTKRLIDILAYQAVNYLLGLK